ncbi:MAG TPA: STAS/SEC14 domain-containing protein [Fimbriimonadaceae bacterium]|nr:STAS/SEC14 domain-containing protein [Fimbriimonadaceae bacterium]
MIEIVTIQDRYILARASSKLTPEDYHLLDETIKPRLTKHHTVRVQIEFRDFHGWTLPGVAAAIRFGLTDGKVIEKLAVVGEHKTEEALAWVVEVFGSTVVEFFGLDRAHDAWKWLHADEVGEYLSYASFGTVSPSKKGD